MKKIGSPLYAMFLLYTLSIICIEWINLLFKILGYVIPFGITEIISAIIVVTISVLTRKIWEFEPLKINLEKIIGILIIAVFGFILSVYPDKAYDTHNYHLIAQNPLFENYFTEDFAYGNFQVWGFRLPDRLFYYFRYLLGYRLGTILNVFVLILSFTQLYAILESMIEKFSLPHSKSLNIVCNKLIWTLGILLPLDAILMLGTYYVDILAIPFALEIVRLFLNEDKNQRSIDIWYFALLNGIFVAFKLTNIVYAIPFVCFYVIKNFKSIKIIDWICAVSLGLFPFANYLIFNFICTGNPVFPYFNAIFKSPFFPATSWKDHRWGGSSFFEKLFWCVYAAVQPEYRQSEIYDARPVTLIIGLAGTLVMFFLYFYNKKYEKKKSLLPGAQYVEITILTLTAAFLWAFTTGYARYFLFGKVLWGFLAYWFLVYISTHYDGLGKILSLGCSIAVSICICLNSQSCLEGRNWPWNIINAETYRTQIQKVLSDRDITTDNNIDPDVFVVTAQEYMGIAELVNNNVYVINTNYSNSFGETYQSYYKERMDTAELMYDIHPKWFNNIIEYVENLNLNELYVKGITSISVGAGDYYLMEVDTFKKSSRANSVWISNQQPLEIHVDENNKETSLHFIAGRYYDWEGSEHLLIKLDELDADGNKQELALLPVSNFEVQEFTIPLSTTTRQIVASVCYTTGEAIPSDELNQVFILNWTID